MVDEWLTPVVGLVGIVAGYCISHFLSIREKSISREFEMYQNGREYLQSLYGYISVLFDLVDGYVRAKEKGKAQISDVYGFITLTDQEIIDKYRLRYQSFTQFLGNSKKEGREIFLRKDLARDLEDFWVLAALFYETGDCDKTLCDQFDTNAVKAMVKIEKILGIRPYREIPQVLKVSNWKEMIKRGDYNNGA